ncbi:MAG: COG1470 family protein [Thermoplasmatota archaeon]
MVVGWSTGRWLLAGVGVLALLAMAPSADAQIQSCGEGLELFIRNPDIIPDQQGVFAVSGRLLVQFQVIGERADEIEAFGLSFGADLPTGDEVCALPPAAWLTGVYAEGYAVDLDKSDGFFIAINSNGQTSPQYDLGVAVHGYNAAHDEIARFWGIVRLDHCGGQPQMGCPEADFPDFTMPWPILLPGDGSKSYVEGFTFEFNEELSALAVELNGIDITNELEEWAERPAWDQDSIPDAGPGGAFLRVAGPCTQPAPVHTCGPMAGPAHKWTKRALTDDDVVRILATDLKGNVAIKEIHIGSSVAGGTIADGLPVLQMTFQDSLAVARPGDLTIFTMRMQNTGGGTGHPFASAEVPAGWTYEWLPGHQPVPPGGTSEQELQVTVPSNTTAGRYQVKALIEYRKGTEDRTLESTLNVDVLGGAATNTTGDNAAPDVKAKGAPLPAAVPLFALAVALVAVRSARRRD